jgi:multiple sugar transport system permease protein
MGFVPMTPTTSPALTPNRAVKARLQSAFRAPSHDERNALALLGPLLIVLIVVAVFPIAYSFVTSLYDINLARPLRRPFVGLDNYLQMLGEPRIQIALWRTTVYTLVTVAGTTLAALAVALFLNETFRGRRILAILLLVPWATPSVVNGLMWKWIYDSNYGVLNGLLRALGLIDNYKIWLADPDKTLFLIANAAIWKQMPLSAILLLVTMKSIPEDLYKAARVDGANVLQRFLHVTLPALRPGLMLVLVYETMISVRHFDLFMLLTQGGPGNASSTLSWQIYIETFRSLHFGTGSALAYILAFITLILGYLMIRFGWRRGTI